MSRILLGAAALAVLASQSVAQPNARRPPVIDMHVHSASIKPEQQLQRMHESNIRSPRSSICR